MFSGEAPPRRSADALSGRWTIGIGARQSLQMGILGGLAVVAFAICSLAFVSGDHGFDRILLGGGPGPFESPGPIGPRWLRELSWDLTALGSPGVVGALVSFGAGFLYLARRRSEALHLVGLVGSGTAFGYLLKQAFGILRPHHAAGSSFELSTSFPSGHAILASLLCASVVLVVSRTAPLPLRNHLTRFATVWAVLLSLSVGLSRIHLGLHWPTDVIAGWIAGIGWAVLYEVLAPVSRSFDRD